MKKDLQHKLITPEIMELVNYYLSENLFNERVKKETIEVKLNPNQSLIYNKFYFITEIYNEKIYIKTLGDLENEISDELNFDKIFKAYEILKEIKLNKNTTYMIKYKNGGYVKNECTSNYNTIFGYKDNEYCSHFYGIYGDVLYKIEKEIGENFTHGQVDNRDEYDFTILKIIAKILECFDVETEKEFQERKRG